MTDNNALAQPAVGIKAVIAQFLTDRLKAKEETIGKEIEKAKKK